MDNDQNSTNSTENNIVQNNNPNLNQQVPSIPPVQKKSKKILLALAFGLMFIAVTCLIVFLFLGSRNQSSTNQASSKESPSGSQEKVKDYKLVFPNLEQQLSDQELLKTAIKRAMEVESVKYNVYTDDSIAVDGVAAYDFSAETTRYHTTNFDRGATIDQIVDLKDQNQYVRLNVPGSKNDSVDEKERHKKFNNKWLLINSETTQNLASGSEYLGFMFAQTARWELPILIGNLSNHKDFMENISSGSGFSIKNSEDVLLDNIESKKLTIDADIEKLSSTYNNDKNSVSTRSVYPTRLFSQTGEEKITKVEFVIWIAKSNAQILSAERTLIEVESRSTGKAGSIYKYDKFLFDSDIEIEAPSSTIPFNEYWGNS